MGNRAVVLSGGGAKGAYQVGALEYLVNERGLEFQVISGVSTGSISAIVLAQAADLAELRHEVGALGTLYRGIRSNRDIYRNRFLGQLGLFFHSSLYDAAPLRGKLERAVNVDAVRRSGRELRMGAACLETGEYRTITQRDDRLIDFTMASGATPVFFPPVAITEQGVTRHWVDGGVRHMTPLRATFQALRELAPADDATPDEMYILLCDPLDTAPQHASWNSALPIAERAADLLDNQIYRDDLVNACLANRAVLTLRSRVLAERTAGLQVLDVDLGLAAGEDARYVRLFAVVPDRDYMRTLEFDPAAIARALRAGYDAARTPANQDELERKLGVWPGVALRE